MRCPAIIGALLLGSFDVGAGETPATPDAAAQVLATALSVTMPAELRAVADVQIASLDHLRLLPNGEGVSLGLLPLQRRVNGGIRSEIAVDYPFREGETVRYAWRCRIPLGTATDAPRNRWWLLGQWHVQPDRLAGETAWGDRHALSPPIALGFGYLAGRSCMALTYGVEPKPVLPTFAFTLGTWHQFEVEILWSQSPAGKALVRLDGVDVAAASGANMQNGYQHFFKFGQYRHPDIATESWIDLAGLRIVHVDRGR